MPNLSVMDTVVSNLDGRTQPGIESDLNPVSDPVKMRDAVYHCLQLAVDAFGGANELAEAMGAARSDTFLRIARKEDSKGALQRAFLDFLGPLLTHDKARHEFVTALLAVLGYERPVPRRQPTKEQVGASALDWVRSLPPSMRDAARADIARALGVRVEDLKL